MMDELQEIVTKIKGIYLLNRQAGVI